MLRIDAEHPALTGHFPGFPIVPGVVLLDEMLHAIDQTHSAGASPWHIDTVKFHHIARPGENLQLKFEWHPDGVVRFELHHADTLLVSGSARHRARIRAVVSAR